MTTPSGPAAPQPLDERRLRFYRATVSCVATAGLAATSVEDVARAAGSSRATLYRVFPGGRAQLVHETVVWEVAEFFARLEAAVADEPDLVSVLTRALSVGHRAISEHALLQQLLRTEPEAVLAELAGAMEVVLEAISAHLAGLLTTARRAGEVRADCDVDEAGELLARLYLSYLAAPGRWDLDDPDQVATLVARQFLAGVAGPGQPRE